MFGDGVLKPRQNFSNRGDISRHFIVANAHVDAAIPKPTDINVNLGVVNLLKFIFECHTVIFALANKR